MVSITMIIDAIDWTPPSLAARAYAGVADAHLLTGGALAARPGRSVLVAAPAQLFEIRAGRAFVDGDARDGDPFSVLGDLLAARRRDGGDGAPDGFVSGAVGYVGYEVGGVVEPSAYGPPSPYALPDARFGFYDAAYVFDGAARRAWSVAKNADAAARLAEAARAPAHPRPVDAGPVAAVRVAAGPIEAGMDEAAHAETVRTVRDEILRGDYFQANVAYPMTARLSAGGPFDFFAALHAQSAAPFCAFLQYTDGAVASVSPERFFRIEGRRIGVEPVKGTRPRGRDARTDRALAAALEADPKERAENVMIADLMRNDLSRLCDDASISEDVICALETFASVHHLVSRISGDLRAGVGPAEALRALVPCGSITGAPKIEAMNAIARLEPTGRGPYTGAIGYIDDRGDADFSVAIRTAILEPDGAAWRATYPVGGGLTALSEPGAEHAETLAKAAPFFAALGRTPGVARAAVP
ncbi:MAG: anthranilate synthase component I family protein [Pseudomonadota bacterium]